MGFKCPERKRVADFLQEVTSRIDQQQYWVCHDESYNNRPVDDEDGIVGGEIEVLTISMLLAETSHEDWNAYINVHLLSLPSSLNHICKLSTHCISQSLYNTTKSYEDMHLAITQIIVLFLLLYLGIRASLI